MSTFLIAMDVVVYAAPSLYTALPEDDIRSTVTPKRNGISKEISSQASRCQPPRPLMSIVGLSICFTEQRPLCR